MKKKLVLIILCSFISYSTWSQEEHHPVSDSKPLIIRLSTTAENVPDEISKHDSKFGTYMKNHPYEILLLLQNDSFTTSGDDENYTHGLRIIGTTPLYNGIRLKVAYTTDLYTLPTEDSTEDERREYFTDDNFLRFIFDNVDQGKAFYWKAELGWHQLNSIKSDNPFYGSTQQRFVHGILNKINDVHVPTHINDGTGRADSIDIGASIGKEGSFNKGNADIHYQIETGLRLSGIDDAGHSYASGMAGVSYSFFGKYRFDINGGIKVKAHDSGVEYNPMIGAEFNTSRVAIGVYKVYYKGNIQNYMKYNLPSEDINKNFGKYDPTIMAFFTYKFGAKKSIREKSALNARDWVLR